MKTPNLRYFLENLNKISQSLIYFFCVTFRDTGRLPIKMQADKFKQIVIPIRTKMFRFACMLLNNYQEAEDVVQETFLKLWIKKDELEKINNIEAWSITLVRNLSYDKLKKRKMERLTTLESGGAWLSVNSEEQNLHRNERLENIYRYIRELPPRQQQAIFLRDIEGHSYHEISEIMGIDENLVKVTLFRARENLRKKILKIENYGL